MAELTTNQIYTIMNSINKQVTGNTAIAAVDTKTFISVAQTTLETGYEPVLNAISQVLSRTIISSRRYQRRFSDIEASNQRYGGITRKINYLDSDTEKDEGYGKTDGQSVDQYTILKPKVLQTNFYGFDTYERHQTFFREQLNTGFKGPEEFGEFISGALTNLDNQMDQDIESTARLTIANFIAGVKDKNNAPQIVHLLTEYNAETGLQLDATTVMAPTNFPAFMQWVYGRIAGISSMLEERSELYHFNLDAKPIKRFTPMSEQHCYMFAPQQYMYTARVLADTYHDNLIRYANYKPVNYWQAIKSPAQIQIKPKYFDTATGGIKQSAGPVTVDKIFGCIFDSEALGYSIFNKDALATPINARGRYYNIWYNYTVKYWNDFTENFVLLLLD